MGLTKQYLAYRPIDSLNIISSGRANVNFLIYNNIVGRFIVSAAAENVIVWDLRLGERVVTLHRENNEVTALRVSPDRMKVAVGYADGVVKIFDVTESETAICTLPLHKTAISILRYDEDGIRLVSGSLDTDLVIVDVVEQAGRHRLLGHNAPITDAHFLQHLVEQSIVISSSKDTQIKFWNLETQFCFKTIVDNRTEVWALAFVGDLMVAASSDSGMNVYRLNRREGVQFSATSAVEGLSIDNTDTISPITVTNCGIILRAGRGRTVNLVADPTERVLSCHGTNNLIENFYICNEAEAKTRLAKRLKKLRKATKNGKNSDNEDLDESKELSITDKITRLESINVNQKIKSIDVLLSAQNELRLLVSCCNNSLHLYSIAAFNRNCKPQKESNGNNTAKLLRSLTRHGHQSEVRTVCFSGDSLAIGSGACESFKFWSLESRQCLWTVPSDHIILCAIFVPGDRYALLGLKSGKMLIVDVSIADVVEEIIAHDNALLAIALLPDQQGCVTGSSDSTVKIWIFELIDNSAKLASTDTSQPHVLSMLHKNTLKLDEAVLCLRVSPDMKYLVIGLIDSTVKIFFLDTFKFYLSLYGHKLPVLCLDISYDSKLVATGSADRNVKIWGLDFGDCHRSLFAHDDSVMGLQFIPKTHMFFTCGKDGKIKQWDGDTFDKIITMPGHIGEAYSLAVSPNGRYVVSCGSDRTLRICERTDEPIILKDVQEDEREEIENQQLATGDDNTVPLLPSLKLASRKTVGSEMAAESILECLEICKQYDACKDERPNLHPLMRAINITNTYDYLLYVMERIRSSELEETLLVLPFSNVLDLLERLPRLIKKHCDSVELLCKITVFLFKVHMLPITSTKSLKILLGRLIKCLRVDVAALRDVVGMNLHALKLLQHDIKERDDVELFREATQERKKRKNKQHNAIKRHAQRSGFI